MSAPAGRAVLVTGASRGIGAAVARAFAANGDLYIALNPLSELIRVSARGARQILATHADGLQNTSAVAFDPRAGRRRHLFITNSSYFGTTPTLQATPANTVGRPLPACTDPGHAPAAGPGVPLVRGPRVAGADESRYGPWSCRPRRRAGLWVRAWIVG